MAIWSSRTGACPDQVDRLGQVFLRRFDLEHTLPLFKQALGWTIPRLRDAAAADRWTWLIITVHTQLRLARDLTTDLRRPRERPAQPNRLTPARVRRRFRSLHPRTSRPGPGRPLGSTNRRPATRHAVGKPPHCHEPSPDNDNNPAG